MCVCVYRKDAHAKTLNGTLPLINPGSISLLYSSSFHLSVSSSLPLPIPPQRLSSPSRLHSSFQLCFSRSRWLPALCTLIVTPLCLSAL